MSDREFFSNARRAIRELRKEVIWNFVYAKDGGTMDAKYHADIVMNLTEQLEAAYRINKKMGADLQLTMIRFHALSQKHNDWDLYGLTKKELEGR